MLITSSGTTLAPQYIFLSNSRVSEKAKQFVWEAEGEVARDGTKTAVTPGERASCVLEISFGGFSASSGF